MPGTRSAPDRRARKILGAPPRAPNSNRIASLAPNSDYHLQAIILTGLVRFAYVEFLVKTKQYSGASQVLEEALRRHRVSRPGFDVVMTPELEKLLDEGMEDLEQAVTTEQLRQNS